LSGASGNAIAWVDATSLAMSVSVIPPMRETQPLNATSMASAPMPMASKICAAWYEDSSEMPILDMILNRPASTDSR
jgi:hypothetical protein